MVDETILNITTQKEFSKLVEKRLHNDKLGVMDAIVTVCEDTGVDPSDCNNLLSASIKAKLEAEAMELNLLPRGNQLPL